MTKKLLFKTAFVSCLSFNATAQDTFSIVGLDTLTGEVGSAGASCVDLFQTTITDPSFLSHLIPGKGAINTQAAYHPTNQNNARTRMNAGDTPSQIIAWMVNNDINVDPTIRQYGIVGSISGSVMTAAWTGSNCITYANHILGRNYSIQGNILLGQVVLDSMESKFKRTPGTLACKLMAALQGAKMVGADTRCSPNNSSSLFAFVKVSKPSDVFGQPYISIGVKTHTNDFIEPIDSLQTIANNINLCGIGVNLKKNSYQSALGVYPNPAKNTISILNASPYRAEKVIFMDMMGKEVLYSDKPNDPIDIGSLAPGVYFIEVREGLRTIYRSRVVKE
jgi:uncharacterized Ntn-hydrolase superfamily protein